MSKMDIYFNGEKISRVFVGTRQLFPNLERTGIDRRLLAEVPECKPFQVDMVEWNNWLNEQAEAMNAQPPEKPTDEEIQQTSEIIHQMFTQQELEQGLDYQAETPRVSRYGKVWYKPSLYEDWIQSDANIDGETFVSFNEINEAIEVIVPEQTNSGRVNITKINAEAFKDCKILKKIVLPSYTTTIGKWAFRNCISLDTINFPNTVTTINEAAFDKCQSLTGITLPSHLTTLEEAAFIRCKNLKTVSLGDLIKDIKYATFAYCENIERIMIPASIRSIAAWAFGGCTKLKDVEIRASEEFYMFGQPFVDCPNLEWVYFPRLSLAQV